MSSASQAAAAAVKKLLRKLGKQYDISRGLNPFSDNKSISILKILFENECSYCGSSLQDVQSDKDHLVPMNKDQAGLHAWGNIIPTCKSCNNARLNLNWQNFLKSRSMMEADYEKRLLKINSYISEYKYYVNEEQQRGISRLANELHISVASIVKNQINEKIAAGSEIFK